MHIEESKAKVYGRVYLVTNLFSGKQYVGLTTKTIKSRWRAHCNPTSRCSALALAIQKYGPGSFSVSEIDTAESLTELNDLERHYVEILGTLAPKGYNLRQGGGAQGGWSPIMAEKIRAAFARPEVKDKLRARSTAMWGRPETREKISGAIKAGLADPEVKERRSKIAKERAADPEFKKRISAARKEIFADPEIRRGISERARVRFADIDYKNRVNDAANTAKRDPEYRARVSASLMGLWQDPAYADKARAQIQAVTEANRGRKRSPETIAKMRAAQLERWRKKRAATSLEES